VIKGIFVIFICHSFVASLLTLQISLSTCSGWEEGLQDMCPGEKRKLIVPPKMAYGHRGVDDTIPRLFMFFFAGS
jgi:FKBP-type peptidyl-prolyl cis-trans isomerase